MNLFRKILKHDDQAVAGTIPREIYKSVRVMRDDLNELEGKPSEQIPGLAEPDLADSGHPFLGIQRASSADVTPSVAGMIPPTKNMKKWLIPASIVVVVLMVGGGMAYFFFRPTTENDMTAPLPSADIPAAGDGTETRTAEPTPAPTDAFSIDGPNYLTLDPESDAATVEGILAKLEGVRTKVKEMNPSEPVEFLLRDGNNNPIAFSRFSYLMKLGIPEDTLSFIDEPFSVYFVPEKTDMRMALVVDVNDSEKFAEAVKRDESAIPTWFRVLLYEVAGVEVPSSVEFRGGTYGALETRFAPIDTAKNYSFDYILLGNKWVIGTSKDSFRTTVDAVVRDGIE